MMNIRKDGRIKMPDKIDILVVEDDEDINQLLCKIIKKSGYYPQSAYSGTEAIMYLEKQNWDLILLDLMLPGMDGVAVLEKIRERSEEHTSELQSRGQLVSRLLLDKK